jgi:hypothetical protein
MKCSSLVLVDAAAVAWIVCALGLGVGAGDRLIVWPHASWQYADLHADPAGLILPRLHRLDRIRPRVHIVHVRVRTLPPGHEQLRALLRA